MRASYGPHQMGYATSAIPVRRATDNHYVRSRRDILPEFRTDFVVRAGAFEKVKARQTATKLTLDKPVRVWYDCQCGRQTRNETGKCDHPGVTYLGLDNIGKDHL